MSENQFRTNPSQYASNFRGRSSTSKGWPSTAVSTWTNGGLFGSPADFSGGSRSNPGDGYSYQTYEVSSTVTCESGGLVDLILVGAGGGRMTGSFTGGAGGGGVIYATGVTVAAGTYSLTVGAGNSGTDPGGFSSILFAGWNLYAGGGGNGGYGGWANCGAGGGGTVDTPSSPYVTVRGAGGGGGVWAGYCMGGPGYGGNTATSGTGSGGGTWSTITSGNGGGSGSAYSSSGGGGGSGAGTHGDVAGPGAAGYTWNSVRYADGGDGGGVNTPMNDGYGQGAGSTANITGNNGVFIVRFPE